jgi:Na+/citrate or Na+/malate symporter
LQHFVVLIIPALAGPTGRGRMPLSDITLTIHHPVAQSKPAIKVSIIN